MELTSKPTFLPFRPWLTDHVSFYLSHLLLDTKSTSSSHVCTAGGCLEAWIDIFLPVPSTDITLS